MLKEKFLNVVNLVKANKEAIIKKGLVLAGAVVGAVVVGLLTGGEAKLEEPMYGDAYDTEETTEVDAAEEQPVAAEVE